MLPSPTGLVISKKYAPGQRSCTGEEGIGLRIQEDESDSAPGLPEHTQPGRVLDHTPAAMLRRMGDGSARALKKVVSSSDMRRVGARSL